MDHTIHHCHVGSNRMDTLKIPISTPTCPTPIRTSSKLPDQLPKPIVVSSKLLNGVAQQTKHALDLWDSVLRQGNQPAPRPGAPPALPTSLSYDDFSMIRQQLLEGYVPPVFHAYATIPEQQRLFHPHVLVHTGCSIIGGTPENPNDTPIRVSCRKVVAGQCYRSNNDNSCNVVDDTNQVNQQNSPMVARPTTVVWSTSRTIVPCQPDPHSAHQSHHHHHTTTTATGTTTTTKNDDTISFECDYMTTFLDTATGLARPHVSDPGYIHGWTFSASLTHELVHLINTPAEMIGEDVEVTRLLSNFQIQAEQNDPTVTCYGTSMITRRLSRGVVLDCFKQLQHPSRTLAITGNRGIGKSYTLLFALQQALLYNKMCILLFTPKQQKAILCIRHQEQVFAWEGTMIHHMAISSLFTNPNVFVLLDPLDAEDGGTNYAIGARRLMYTASNHVEHFNQPAPTNQSLHPWHLKPVKNCFVAKERYLSPPTEGELRVALPFMLNVNNTTLEEAMQRTYHVGTIPKYVLNDGAYQERKQHVDQYIKLLQTDSNEMLRLLNWNGMLGATLTADPSLQNASDELQFTASTDDTIDDTFEVNGIAVDRISESHRMKHEGLTADRRHWNLPTQPVNADSYKFGQPLPNHLDGTLILSLNSFEPVDRATPFGHTTPRSTTKLIGYNGEHQVRYHYPKMTIASQLIYDTLIEHYAKENPSLVVALWGKVGNGHHNGMKNCVTDLFWEFVIREREKVDALPPRTSHLQQRNVLHRWKCYKLGQGDSVNSMSEWHVPIAIQGRRVARMTDHRDHRYPLQELKEIFRADRRKNVTPKMIRLETHVQNIIHFAGPGRVVYQIVNDDDFTIHYEDMVKVLAYGKYLLWHQKVTARHGAIRCAPKPPSQKLEWYFVVPRGQWERRNPPQYDLEPCSKCATESTAQRKERRIRNRNQHEVNQCLRDHVTFYVLIMDLEHYDFSS